MPTNTAWLAELKAGDKVICQSNTWNDTGRTVKQVGRTTKTQIQLKDDPYRKFRKIDGYEVGAFSPMNLRPAKILPWTPEAAADIALERRQNKLSDILHDIKRSAIQQLTAEQCTRLLTVLAELGLWQAPDDVQTRVGHTQEEKIAGGREDPIAT